MTAADDDVRPVDPRRALGRRPGGQPSRLDIDDSTFYTIPPSPTFNPPGSPRNPQISLTIPASPSSNRSASFPHAAAPSPTSPSFSRFRRHTASRTIPSTPSLKGLYETQKLLSHLLDRLEDRSSAPDLLSLAAVSAREVSGRTKSKHKGRAVRIGQVVAAAAQTGLSVAQGNHGQGGSVGISQGVSSGDVDEQIILEEEEVETDQAYDLLEQTRSLLLLADKQGLDLFSSDSEVSPSSPTNVRNTQHKPGRFTSFASPVSPQVASFASYDEIEANSAKNVRTISGHALLLRLLSVLRSLIEIDSLHKTHGFSPLRPPMGLQAACLDIATWLYHHCGWSIKVDMVDLVTTGLYTMGEIMTERICEWLEGRVSELLDRLARERGGLDEDSKTAWSDPFGEERKGHTAIPTFAFSVAQESAVPSSALGWRQYPPSSPTDPIPHRGYLGILSSHSATITSSPLTLHLASLVPRMLFALTSTIDMAGSKLTTLYRVHRLLSLLITAKVDSSLDLLEVVAYAPSPSRRAALGILNTFFPVIMGHNVITRRPASMTYLDQRTRWETGQEKVLGEDSTEDHHFIPWRLSSREGRSDGHCSTCRGEIHGFCIKCTLCRQYRHLHCYNHHDYGFQYEIVTVSSRNSAPNTVITKFSLCPLRLEEMVVTGSIYSDKHNASRRRIGHHHLCLVNLFTTTLCSACTLPLWGTMAQAYACMNRCQGFYHADCLSLLAVDHLADCHHGNAIIVDEVAATGRYPYAVSLTVLVESFKKASSYLCVDKAVLGGRSYDEIAILYGALWTQYQLLKNGLASGSIQIEGFDVEKTESDALQLRPYLRAYEEHLRLHEAYASSAAADFGHVINSGQVLGQGYLFSERYLTYIAALLKSPASPGRPGYSSPSEDFMTDQNALDLGDPQPDEKRPVYEALEISSVTRTLALDLALHDSSLVVTLLNQLIVTGLIAIPRTRFLTSADIAKGTAMCSFGLPLLMDSSSTVELLIASVEKLLADVDLTMNETALNLVSVRAWPSLLCSPYSLERLGTLLVRWVVSQDETIHEIVKQYASKHRRLPGVRSGLKGSSSVQAYKDDRMALRVRYAEPWLHALHDQDPIAYAHAIYEECRSPDGLAIPFNQNSDEAAFLIAERALDRMTVMADAGLMFNAQLDLITAWLEDLGGLTGQDHSYRSLPRLLKKASRTGHGNQDSSANIWELIRQIVREGSEGLSRACKWLRVLSCSGAEIPWSLVREAITSSQRQITTDESRLDLLIAVDALSTSVNAGEFASLCCLMFLDFIKSQEGAAVATDTTLNVLKQHMLVILRAYGVTLEDVVNTKLSDDNLQSKQPASMFKRKRSATLATLLTIDENVIIALADVLSSRIFPVEITLDFMWLLFTRSTNTINIDGFLHKQCSVLYPVLWSLVDGKVDRLSRARLFLRLLAVNSAPMEMIIKEQFHQGDRSGLREKLLQFTLELADESLTHENISWRRSSVGLVILFFEALLDHTDVGPDKLVILHSMLPTQLRAVSGCFEEYLAQASDAGRLGLMARLQRLCIALPSWPVVSWKALDDLLTETSASIAQITPARSSQTVSALVDSEKLRADLVALGLEMISAGIEIPWPSAQQFQVHTAQALSPPLRKVPLDPVCTLVLPALRSVLDAPHRITIGSQSVDSRTKKTALVGALFVPLIIELGRDLDVYDFMTQRTVLDILHVTFFKQNTRTVELSALGALQSIAEFVNKQGSSENRLLGLGILQIAIGRVEKDSLVRAIPLIFAIICEVLVTETQEDGDAAIIDQSRFLLKTTITTFGRSRIFVQLFKNDGLKQKQPITNYLAKALQMLRATERPGADGTVKLSVLDLAINDLPDALKKGRRTTEQVLQSFERFTAVIEGGISEDAVIHFGAFVTRLGKHVTEWDGDEFDPNPVLRSCASLLALSSNQNGVTLLHQVSTLLHLALSRFEVNNETVKRLLRASHHIVKDSSENTIQAVMFELAHSALGGLTVRPNTLDSLLYFVNHLAFPALTSRDTSPAQERSFFTDCAGGCMSILLRQHSSLSYSGIDPEVSFSASYQAATILLRGDMTVPGLLNHHLTSMTSEAASTQLGVFTYILYASLSIELSEGRRRLLVIYPILARAISLCLRGTTDLLAVKDLEGQGADLLSVVFTVFRLALLATEDPKGEPKDDQRGNANGEVEGGNASAGMVSGGGKQVLDSLWTRIWPDWYRLLSLSVEGTCVNTPLKNIAHTVFLDTLIYLKTIHSPLLTAHAGSLGHALRLLHRNQGTAAHGVTKMIKAEGAVLEAGLNGGMVEYESVQRVLKADLLVSERLRVLRQASQ